MQGFNQQNLCRATMEQSGTRSWSSHILLSMLNTPTPCYSGVSCWCMDMFYIINSLYDTCISVGHKGVKLTIQELVWALRRSCEAHRPNQRRTANTRHIDVAPAIILNVHQQTESNCETWRLKISFIWFLLHFKIVLFIVKMDENGTDENIENLNILCKKHHSS